MKKLFGSLSLLLLLALRAFGQGQLFFDNYIPGLVDAPVTRSDGTGAGAGISAELMMVTPTGDMVPLGSPTTFRTTTGETAYINPETLAVPGMLPGTVILVRMVAFNGSDFDTSTLIGESNEISVDLGGGLIVPPNLVGLQGFSLTATGTPPIITTDPKSQTVVPGTSVSFSVAAIGSDPLSYQWQKSDSDIAGATSQTLTIASAKPSDAANYRVMVSNSAGKATSHEAALSVLTAPEIASPLQNQTVNAGADVSFLVKVSGDKLKFQWQHNGKPITGATTAQLNLPAVQTGDGGSYLVTVSNDAGKATSLATLTIMTQATGMHPADNNPADFSMSQPEADAYAQAWRQGNTWPKGPNPIPPSYVSRAGALWKGGQAYKVDFTVKSGPPLWWVNTSAAGPQSIVGVGSSPQAGLDSHGNPGTADGDGGNGSNGNSNSQGNEPITVSVPDKYVPGVSLTIESQVNPPAGTLAYLVAEVVPQGWTVSKISDEGSFDAANHTVKWGLFYDANPRTLSFDLLPPQDSKGKLRITGLASFDGYDVPLGGHDESDESSKFGHLHRNGHGGDLDITLEGGLGQTFAIEVSTDLVNWTQVATFTNVDGLIHFLDSDASALKQKFFRAVIVP